ALHMHAKNLRDEGFVPFFTDLLQGEPLSEGAQEVLAVLDECAFEDHIDEPAPLIFDHLFNELDLILYDKIDDDVLDLFTGMPQTTDELLRKGDRSVWVDNAGGLTNLVSEALEETRSEEHTSELQSRFDLVCRLPLAKTKTTEQR